MVSIIFKSHEKHFLLIFILLASLCFAQQKALVINEEVKKVGLPTTFIRANGQTIWGGYETRTDLHRADGWRDLVIPAYNDTTQQLGEMYYNIGFDIVTYRIVERTSPTIDEMKAAIREDLFQLMMEFSGLITACNNLYGDDKPESLVQLINTVRGLKSYANTEIDALQTRTQIARYTLRGPQVQALLGAFKSYLK